MALDSLEEYDTIVEVQDDLPAIPFPPSQQLSTFDPLSAQQTQPNFDIPGFDNQPSADYSNKSECGIFDLALQVPEVLRIAPQNQIAIGIAATSRTSRLMPGDPDWPEGLNYPNELNRSTSASILDTESVTEEMGRTYHGYKEGKYFLPNDGPEQDRLDFQHAGFMRLTGWKYAFAPMTEEPKIVLDVATGTGIWAIEYARQHPDTKVVGTDLSAIQPLNAPENCEFIKDDSESEWVFPYQFDYVHMRFVVSCFNDPSKVIRSAFESLKPGGWLEMQDVESRFKRANGTIIGTAMKKWSDAYIKGAECLGRDIEVTHHYGLWMRHAGFVDVTERKVMWPLNSWPQDPKLKEIGEFQRRNICEGVLLTTWKLMRASGLSPVEAQALTDEVKFELKDTSNQFYFTAYIITGRKPLPSEQVTQGSFEVTGGEFRYS